MVKQLSSESNIESEVSLSTLENVWHDNIRNNQIGGKADGITPELAEDLGYFSPEHYGLGVDPNPHTTYRPLTVEERRIGIEGARKARENLEEGNSDGK